MKSGRPVQEVPTTIARSLERVRVKEERARLALEAVWRERDDAIGNAYGEGVNKNRIATLVGVTVKTVDAALERTGVA